MRFRFFLPVLIAASLALPQERRRPAPPPEPDQEEETAEPEYSFNPIQARKELEVGNFYFKKGSFRAAAGRYERASKWQPDLAEAFYRLGVAREKLDEFEPAIAAYQKYLELSPSARKAGEVKKKIAQLEKQQHKSGKKDDASASRPPSP